MSKKNNVNPAHYKVAGREHTEGADKGDTHEQKKKPAPENKEQVLPGHKGQKK